MTKSVLPNLNKWTTDEKRLLVILLLTLMYPVFVTSFYALYLFVILPSVLSPSISLGQAHHEGWYHIYWLFVSLFWVVLCVLILPWFKKKKVHRMINLGSVESPPHGIIKVEVKDEEDSRSNLSRRSKNSSGDIKKGTDLESEKESLGKSRESLKKSCTSLERKKLTQSGEFLNDFMSTLHSEEAKKDETECEVHAEIHAAENGRRTKTSSSSDLVLTDKERDIQADTTLREEEATEDETSKETSNIKGRENTELPIDKNKKGHLSRDTDSSSDSSSSDAAAEPIVAAQKVKQPQTSSPMKINEATVEQHEDRGEQMTEGVDKLDSDAPEVARKKKALPTIDTSRTSGYYECSMPTPKSVENPSSQNNTVFLYVNPDTADTEDSILVSHGGEVEESKVKETEP